MRNSSERMGAIAGEVLLSGLAGQGEAALDRVQGIHEIAATRQNVAGICEPVGGALEGEAESEWPGRVIGNKAEPDPDFPPERVVAGATTPGLNLDGQPSSGALQIDVDPAALGRELNRVFAGWSSPVKELLAA